MGGAVCRFGFGIAVSLGTIACGAAQPPDPRGAHMARIPARAEAVVQADVAAMIRLDELDAWIGRLARLGRPLGGAACAVDLLRRARYITAAGFAAERSGVAVVAGDLTARDVAACAGAVFAWWAGGEPGPLVARGDRLVIDLGSGVRIAAADLPDASATVVGEDDAVDAVVRRDRDDASFAADPTVRRLRALAGGGDLELILLPPEGQSLFDLPLRAGAVALRAGGGDAHGADASPGAVDLYTIVLMANSAAEARLVSLGVGALLGAVRQMAIDRLDDLAADPETAVVLAEVRPQVEAVAAAIETAGIARDEESIVVTVNIDPALADPMAVAAIAALLLF